MKPAPGSSSDRSSAARPSSGRPTSTGGSRGSARQDRGPGPSAGRASELAERVYDPRREQRRQATRVELPDDVEPQMLDKEVRTELVSLSKDTADLVARHLVMTGRLVDEEPERALAHARAARALAGRIGPVREAAGLAAYAAGDYADALSELRTARRITGQPGHLAVIADCERALGRPERALAVGEDRDVPRLTQAERVELVIVVSGARRDMGQAEAAVLLLQDPAKRTTAKREWAVRLWYAYADALLDAGREDEARDWFSRAAEIDERGETDADERLLALDGISFDDDDDDDDDDDLDDDDSGTGAVPVPTRQLAPERPSAAERGGQAGTNRAARRAQGEAVAWATPTAATAAAGLEAAFARHEAAQARTDEVVAEREGTDEVVAEREGTDEVVAEREGTDEVVAEREGTDEVVAQREGSDATVVEREGADEVVELEDPDEVGADGGAGEPVVPAVVSDEVPPDVASAPRGGIPAVPFAEEPDEAQGSLFD